MRPVRLLLDGFGCYRQAAEADFSDVEFFALVGPTGSGKSTLIDGLCFALYGTVPRWGKENAIAQALAPAANACRVCLVFEAAGKRYGAVRALTRDKRGQVHTKEARLELLDPQIPPDAPIADILAASVDQLAEGPDQVKAQVQEILGLTYEHFTQSVLLPQGRFSEFLQRQGGRPPGPAGGTAGVRRVQHGRAAGTQAGQARCRTDARSQTAWPGACRRDRGRRDRAPPPASRSSPTWPAPLRTKLQSLGQLKEQAERAVRQAREAREETGLLAAVQTPAEVPGLAHRIGEADQLLAERRKQRDAAEEAEVQAQQAREALPDKTRMEMLRKAYARPAGTDRAAQPARARLSRRSRQTSSKQAAAVQAAERDLQQARDELAHAERSHAASALAQDLRVGERLPCLPPARHLSPASSHSRRPD